LSKRIAIAICGYNSARSLPGLVHALRQQDSSLQSEIIVIDNNSTDHTRTVVKALASKDGAPVRYAHESVQGIPFARNRAIREAMNNDYLAFIDTDELPAPGWLIAAIDALDRDGADCVGGRICVQLPAGQRPTWLVDELLGFLGEVNHGAEPFWITDRSTPVWSGNIAYNTNVFSHGLRFDCRYNRRGKGVGGGSDAIMFRTLLSAGARVRYRPDMRIDHFIEPDKLRRRYFLRLHYGAGRKYGEFESEDYAKTFFGVPPFMLRHIVNHALKTSKSYLCRDPGAVREAMNLSYALGTVAGRMRRWRTCPERLRQHKSTLTGD
jgi:glycosyltransferase involved in cell wall biosynthesis